MTFGFFPNDEKHETEAGKVATTGDFVLTAQEGNPVLSSLAPHHPSSSALDNHKLAERPALDFTDFCAAANTASVATGIKSARAVSLSSSRWK